MKSLLALVLICTGLVCLGSARTGRAAADNCAPYGSLKFVCGPNAAEDVLRVGNSPWLITSGLAEGNASGHLALVNTRDKTWTNVYPASGSASPDAKRFPDCHTPPDAAKFSAHGLALRPMAAGSQELLVVNHGGREAIEYFTFIPAAENRPSNGTAACRFRATSISTR